MVKNKCYIASAGSGKTTLLVKEALQVASQTKKKVAIVTYTSRNQEEIIKRINEIRNNIPSNVVILGWYEFLIKYWIRPYKGDILSELYDIPISLYFDPTITNGTKYKKNDYISRFKKGDIKSKYFTKEYKLYSNYVSDFAVQCYKKNQYNLIERLSLIFEHLYFDEAQDFVGYDFEIIKLLLTKANIGCTLALDPRQHTYPTAISQKHTNYQGKLDVFIKEKINNKKKQYVIIDNSTLLHSHRCNAEICELASLIDGVYENTVPCNCDECNDRRISYSHKQGVFWVKEANVNEFMEHYNAITLRWNAKSSLVQYRHNEIINFGESKGLTFDACIISPTEKFRKCLHHGVFNLTGETQAKFYVAVTRARFAVGIIVPNNWSSSMQIPFWEPQ